MRILCAFLLSLATFSGSEIRGSIQIKCKYERLNLGISCWGPTGLAVPTTNIAIGGVPLEKLPAKADGWRWGWERGLELSWDPKKGLGFRLRNAKPGWHVVATKWGEGHFYEWKWFEVQEDRQGKTESEINLTIDPSVTGSADVLVGRSREGSSISFMFADDEGKVPTWWPRPPKEVMSERVKEGKAHFKGLRPGRYVFYVPPSDDSTEAPTLAAAGEVKGDAVTQIELLEKK